MTFSLKHAVRFRTLAPELSWFFSRRRLSKGSSPQKDDGVLRKILRRYPWWSRGHFLLGEFYLTSFERAAEPPQPRDLAAVRVSGQAIIDLSKEAEDPVRPLGYYLLGMAAFYLRDYPAAISEFKHVLSPEVSPYVAVRYGIKTLETGGAAAMALQEIDSALRFFTAIPEEYRTPETLSALRYLDAVQRGELQLD